MNLSTALRDGLLNHLFRGAASPRLDAYYVALFTTPPDATGANGVEVTTAQWSNYARQAIDASQAGTRFKAPADGPGVGQRHTDNLDDIDFGAAVIPAADVEVRALGLMSAASGGELLAHSRLAGPRKVFVALDTGDVIWSPGHGFSDGQKVVCEPYYGSMLPGGIAAGEVYHVANATANTFQLEQTPGGGVVALTSDGLGVVRECKYVIVQNGNPVTLPAGLLDIILG